MFKLLLSTNRDLAPLVLRLALGIVMFPHGAQKVLGIWGGHGLAATFSSFSQSGISPFFAGLDIATEFLGPILLLFGFLTRLTGLAMAVMITVAAITVHIPNGFFMNWTGTQHGEGFEYHILVLGIALALMLQGAGRASLDGWIAHEKPETE